MKNFTGLLVWVIFFFACSGPSLQGSVTGNEENSIDAPEAVSRAIKNKFPGAQPYKKGIDSLLNYLKGYDITSSSILWSQSTCVDDITNTKDKLAAEIKGPFNFGGLAGLPFTGITGLDAFVHHVPEEGSAVLFISPHIGYNEKDGWGKILRHGQQHTTTCCGALAGALQKLQRGEIKQGVITAEDYQENTIEQLAYVHTNEILSSAEPLVTFTQLTFREASRQIAFYASKVKERHFRYAVIVGGVIINTDYSYPDYLWIASVSILDVQKNKWIVKEKPAFALQ